MDASIKGGLKWLNKCYSWFEHRGQKMTKAEVKAVLEYGLSKGYVNVSDIPDEEVDQILETLKIRENDKELFNSKDHFEIGPYK